MTRRAIRRALVTGATGFVGQALVRELVAQGVQVVAASRAPAVPGVPWVPMTLPGPIDPEALRGVDTVFHLAGIAHAVSGGAPGAEEYDRVNREGSVQVGRAANAAGVDRLVFVSSIKAVGEPGDQVVSEDSKAEPTDPYGTSKRRAEEELLDIGRSGAMEVVIARPTLVYGPGVKGNLAVLASSIRRGSPPPLPVVENRRSLIGIDDLVDALIILAEQSAAPDRVFVLSDGEVYSTDRLVRALAAASGVDPKPRFRIPRRLLAMGARVGDATERLTRRSVPLSTERLRRLLGNAEYEASAARSLGFVPRRSFEDAAGDIVRATDEQAGR